MHLFCPANLPSFCGSNVPNLVTCWSFALISSPLSTLFSDLPEVNSSFFNSQLKHHLLTQSSNVLLPLIVPLHLLYQSILLPTWHLKLMILYWLFFIHFLSEFSTWMEAPHGQRWCPFCSVVPTNGVLHIGVLDN